jgi:PAS domain S-box-containing protein
VAPSSRQREWLSRLALLSLSLLFALGIAEVAARILRSSQRGGKEGGEDARYNEYDPLLGWRKKKNGERFWARVVVTALHDGEGRLRGFAKVTQDLSDRRHIAGPARP